MILICELLAKGVILLLNLHWCTPLLCAVLITSFCFVKKNKNKQTNIVNRKNEEKLQYNYINSIYNDHFEY